MPGSASDDLRRRARRHAALGDPTRLRLLDELARSDRSSSELSRVLDLPTNLLSHHLGVLEGAGLVEGVASSGDRRRRYLRPTAAGFEAALPPARPRGRVVFVCTENSARSPLAAALWQAVIGGDATSAGTHPAETVHPGALAAGTRAGLDLDPATPRALEPGDRRASMVVTVCDRAHEEIGPGPAWRHWSVADPVAVGSARAFDRAVTDLRQRIAHFRN